MDTGLGDQRPAMGDLRLAASDRRLVEERRIEIVRNAFEVLEPERFGREGRVEIAHLFHRASSEPANSAAIFPVNREG